MEKFDNEWHAEHGLRECENQPQEYSLSGILLSLKNKPRSRTDAPVDIGWSAPARCVPYRRNMLQRLKYAWEVITGRASILYYR